MSKQAAILERQQPLAFRSRAEASLSRINYKNTTMRWGTILAYMRH
jgi:hypothetical protein